VADNTLWLNWRGVEGDRRLWQSGIVTHWAEARTTGGATSDLGPSGAAETPQFKTPLRYLAWLGDSGRLHGELFTVSSSSEEVLPYTAAGRPGVALAGGTVHLAWRTGDGTLQWGTGKPGQPGRWSAPADLGGRTDTAPALAVVGGVVHAAWKQAGAEQIMWARRGVGDGRWSAAEALPVVDGGASTSDIPALAATGDGGVAMAWKGISTDPGLWFSTFIPPIGRWSTPQPVVPVGGGVLTTHGPALAWLEGEPWLVWKGSAGDQRLWWARPAGDGRWTAPQIVDPTINSAAGPSLAAYITAQQ
jgi:hypothetical protein